MINRLGLVPLTIIVLVAFAANSLLNRLALAEDAIDAGSFALIRVTSGAVALVVLLALRDRGRLAFGWPSPVGTLSLAAYLLGFSFAYVSMDAGFGALLLFGVVQLTMFGWTVARGQGVDAGKWLSMLLAMSGLILLLWPDETASATSLFAAILMVAAGLGWGLYSLVGGQAKDPLKATALNFLGASLIVVIVVVALPVQLTATTNGIALAVLSGVAASAMGYALWYAILPRLGTVRASLSQLAVPVIAAGLAIPLIGEDVGLRFFLASILVLGGIGMGLARSKS